MPAAFSRTTLPYEFPQLLVLWLRAPAPGVGQHFEEDWVGRLLASIDENRPGLLIRCHAKKSAAGRTFSEPFPGRNLFRDGRSNPHPLRGTGLLRLFREFPDFIVEANELPKQRDRQEGLGDKISYIPTLRCARKVLDACRCETDGFVTNIRR
jgi:hypothetical protein